LATGVAGFVVLPDEFPLAEVDAAALLTIKSTYEVFGDDGLVKLVWGATVNPICWSCSA